jgi:putative sterol carrier protein
VVVFLSPEWFSALDDAARQIAPPAGLIAGQRLVLGQEVRGTPDGVVQYQLVVDEQGVRVLRPPEAPADLTFVCDHATAVALARGVTNAQEALMAGRLQLRGDVERFSVARDAVVALGDVFARVRDVTEFSSVESHG